MDIEHNMTLAPVLIIDDEQDICYMLSNILKRKSFPATSVHTISDAKKWLTNHLPSIIFLDNNLPDGKGIDYVSELKKLLPAIKVIMITAYDTPSDRRHALDSGVDDFIGKPFSRQMIYNAIDRLLN